MCRTRPQTECPWPSAASWDSSLPFPVSVLSQVSVLITGDALAKVKAACAFVSSVTSSFAGCPGSLCWGSSVPVMSPAGRLGWLSPVACVTRGVSSQVENRLGCGAEPAPRGQSSLEGDTAPCGEWLVPGLRVNLCHPWVMENGHSRLDSAKIFWGNFAGHRPEPSTNCTEANLGLDGTGPGLPGGFSVITAAVRRSDTVILIYVIYGNTVRNDSSIYKQD